MREIKFRAWDGEEMVFSQHPKARKSVRIKFGEVALVEKYFNEASEQDAEMRVSAEIMQFTGLLDKNGKEVYEGDVVEYAYTGCMGDKFSFKRPIECQSDGGFRMGGKQIESNPHMVIGGAFNENVTIIGNIYENPELLEENNPLNGDV